VLLSCRGFRQKLKLVDGDQSFFAVPNTTLAALRTSRKLFAAPAPHGRHMGSEEAILSMLPVVGAFVVWIPAAILLLVTGHWVRALIIFSLLS
jgi:hypothetical protein